MRIGRVLNRVYDEDVGWRPVSGTVKPVHIANGLIRALQGSHYDTRRLNAFAVWWRRGKIPDEQRSFDVLLSTDPATFAAFVDAPREFELARKYVLGVLNADNGLFPSADDSAFSLTTGRMVTAADNDRGVGAFAAALLGDPRDEGSLATALLGCATAGSPGDPVTALAWPLLSDERKPLPASKRRARYKRRRQLKGVFDQIRAAANDLASHERAQGNPMRTLQRAVQFVCAIIHAHAQALAADGRLDRRPPALLSMSARRRDVSFASERSLDLIYRAFERWLGERLGERIAAGTPLVDGARPLPANTLNLRSIQSALRRIRVAGTMGEAPDEGVMRERMQHFHATKNEFKQLAPSAILGHALVAIYRGEFESGGPRRFLQRLGRTSGLLYPHFAGRTRDKRMRPSVPMLDMLVRACVPAGQTAPLDTFLEQLWRRFGIIVGGRRDGSWDDRAALAESGVSVDGMSLVENTERFVQELVAMGLARRYADHVTFVGDGHES